MPSGRSTRSAPTSGSAAASGRGPRVAVARRHGATVPQVVLAWDVRGGDTIAIPRSSRPEHTLENAAADAIELTEEDLALISRDFPAPSHKMPLDME